MWIQMLLSVFGCAILCIQNVITQYVILNLQYMYMYVILELKDALSLSMVLALPLILYTPCSWRPACIAHVVYM